MYGLGTDPAADRIGDVHVSARLQPLTIMCPHPRVRAATIMISTTNVRLPRAVRWLPWIRSIGDDVRLPVTTH